MSNDWGAVNAAAQRAGWKLWKADKSRWRGPCPVTGKEYTTVEPADANDGVLMRCYARSCKAVAPTLGGPRYHEHKKALLLK